MPDTEGGFRLSEKSFSMDAMYDDANPPFEPLTAFTDTMTVAAFSVLMSFSKPCGISSIRSLRLDSISDIALP